jgi:SAM-dependent methyltransferase
MKLKTTADVHDLMESYVTSAALGTALELGLFWRLAEQLQTAADVAQAFDIPLHRCRYWLELLVSLGLLECDGAAYALSATARTAILDAYSQESWAYLAREERYRFPVVRDLALHIHEPGSVWAAQGLTPPDWFAQMEASPQYARQFTRMLYELHIPLADELAKTLDMTGVRRLMDLGGGSGVMSLALLRRYPDLVSVIIDIENVCVVGCEIAAEHPEGNRITYHVADFLHDELPGGFDLVLDCDAGDYSDGLLRKLHGVLNPGGRLVIVDQFALEKGVAPASRLHWSFLGALARPDFSFPTAAEVKTRLTQAGFQILSESGLPQGKSRRWSSDWIVIEAGKGES